MAIVVKNGSVICSNCNMGVQSLKDYQRELNRHNPEWFWEPWDASEEHLYICPNCKNEDFISE